MGTLSVRSLHPIGKPFSQRIFAAVYRARYAIPSIFLHLIAFLFVGSLILSQTPVEPPDFQTASGEFVINEEIPARPDEPPNADAVLPESASAKSSKANSLTAVTTASTVQVTATQQSISSGTQIGELASLDSSFKRSIVRDASHVRIGGTGAFGGNEKAQSALVGTFYDLKQTKDRSPSGMTNDQYGDVVEQFAEHFRDGLLDGYFRSPTSLYAGQIMIPDMPATEGPKAFGVANDVKPSRWLALYRAKISPPTSGTYHFVGAGDDVMLVRFNGKLVLDRCWYTHSNWKPQQNYDYGWTNIPKGFAKGDAMNVKAGQWYDLEVLIGEQPGGRMFASLLIEQDGVQYPRDARGNPTLPIFRVADVPMPELERGQTLPPHQEDGPIWKAVSSNSSEFDRVFGPR